MKTYYFGGIEKQATAQILQSQHAAGMMSQLLYSPALMEACDGLTLVMDSGAYSKELTEEDIAAYASLIIQLDDRCIWYANADCIGDQEKTNRNYDYLLSLLPERLHSRILWIYQYGADLEYLYQGLRTYERIGLGGLVPLLKMSDKTLAYQAIIRLAGIVQQRAEPHYFGLSIPGIIEPLHGFHKCFSVDSTTWLVGGKFGLLVNREGKQRPASDGGYNFSTAAILEQNVRTMRQWVERPVKRSTSVYKQLDFLDVA